MPAGLRRIYGKGHLHYITFSCYRRLPLLKYAHARETSEVKVFEDIFEELRKEIVAKAIGH